MEYKYLFYIVFGYLSGSILFGYEIPRILKGIDVHQSSEDGNPGTFNAFMCGGIGCGILTLVAELGKGFWPVAMCRRALGSESFLFVLVMAAPVLGHGFSIFHHGKGGKAIAVSFGVLLGLVPFYRPLLLLILFYLLFSLVLPVKSHSKRTIAAFLCFAVTCFFQVKQKTILLGTLLISSVVIYKHCQMEINVSRHNRRWKTE